MTHTFLSLFSGLGGIDLGLERAGWTCVGQVESNPYCQTVLKRHWPDVPLWRDIAGIDTANLPRPDLIAGGFPCQPVSLAGKQQAQADPRWLWPHFERLIRDLRPRFVLVENVPGLRHRGMGDVLGGLAACGYDAEWDCLPASTFGAPHERDRLWLVAYPNGWGCGVIRQPELAGLEGPRRDLPDGRGQIWQQLDATPDAADTAGQRLEERDGVFARRQLAHAAAQASQWWAVEPEVDRVVDGFAGRVDQVRALGNSVIPFIPEFIGRRLIELGA